MMKNKFLHVERNFSFERQDIQIKKILSLAVSKTYRLYIVMPRQRMKTIL